MNTAILPTNFESFIFQSGDDLKTTSLKVAEAFQKRHDDVLKKIRSLECSAEFHARNFAETVVERVNPSGGQPIKSPAYEMTKDGFMFLVMGFTGKAAAQIKESYINAFNLMHDKLFPKQTASTVISAKDRMTLKDAVNKYCYSAKESQQAVYWRLFRQYGVDKVELLPAGKLDEMLIFLGLQKPDYDDYVLMKQRYILALEQKAKALPAPVVQKFEPIATNSVVIPRSEYDAFKKLDDIVSSIRFALRY
jgi:Rha family phage regulatory protein